MASANTPGSRHACTVSVLAALPLLLHAPTAKAALELHDAQRVVLDNGLVVLLLEDRNFPVVSVQMLYRVGARNEVTGRTGLAHFLEHMAFRATANFPDTEVVSRIYAVGGEWHGYTWTDQTTYYATVPKAYLDLLLEIEAERMQHLEIDPAFIEAERGAVLSEMHMYETEPASLLLDALLLTVFQAHPYRNNTIGFESDVENIGHADVVDFYRAHYHPVNAVLAVVGDFDAAVTRERIDELFGAFPRRPATPMPHTLEPLQRGVRRVELRGTAAGHRFMLGYRAPGVRHPDYAAFLVLQELLAGGSGVSFLQNDWGTPARDGSLLHGAADGITSWFPPSADDYVFVIGGQPGAGAEADTELTIENRIKRLRETAPGEARLGAAIDAVLDELVFDLETTEDAAHQLAFFEGLDALDVLLTLPARIRQVTPADMSRLARRFLAPERRTIAWYRPSERPGHGNGPEVPRPAVAAPVPGAIDATPVAPPVTRRLRGGVPAIVQASDASSAVVLKVVVPGVLIEGPGFVADDPEPGVHAWTRRARPQRFAELAAGAAVALGQARHRQAALRPSATNPATRLAEEFAAAVRAPPGSAAGRVGPAVIVVAGDVDVDLAFATLERHFGGATPATPGAPDRTTRPDGEERIRLGMPVAQSQLGYLVAAPAPSEPDYAAWRLLQYIVAHDYEGRLGKAAISDRGLAYYVDARYASPGGPGWITLAIGVDTHKLEALEALIAAEFARLATEPPTAAEVAEAKQHLLGRETSAAQSNGELATRLARHWLRFGELPSVDELRARLDAVTREDVVAIVPAFTSGLTITVSP